VEEILALPYYSHRGLCASMGGTAVGVQCLRISERFFIANISQ